MDGLGRPLLCSISTVSGSYHLFHLDEKSHMTSSNLIPHQNPKNSEVCQINICAISFGRAGERRKHAVSVLCFLLWLLLQWYISQHDLACPSPKCTWPTHVFSRCSSGLFMTYHKPGAFDRHIILQSFLSFSNSAHFSLVLATLVLNFLSKAYYLTSTAGSVLEDIT